MQDGMHINEYGTKIWFKNGQRHREDGPAVILANGTKWWCKDGMCHREDGPAVEYADGLKAWWVNGKSYSFDGWLKATPIPAEDKLFLKLKWT